MNAASDPIPQNEAQDIAIKALSFLAQDPDRLLRFFSQTGLDPQTLRKQAHTIQAQAAILDHLLRDESLLLVFCANTGCKPETIAPAHRALAPPSEN